VDGSERRRSLVAVVGSVFGVGVAYGALIPLISLRLEADGVDSLLIGIQGAMFPLATLAIGAFIPALVSRVSLLLVLYASLGVAAASVMLFPVFPTLSAWFVLRFVTGSAGTVHWVASEIWMNALATARDRSRLMGIYATMLAAGFAIGPLVVRATGIEGWRPFAAVAVGVLVAALPLPLAHARVPALPPRHGVRLRGLFERVPGVLLAALLAGLLDAAVLVFLPLVGVRSGLAQRDAVTLVAWFMAGNLVFQIPLGWWADRTDRWTALRLCVACSLLGALLLPVLAPDGWLPSKPLLAAVLFVWGGTSFGLYTLSLAVLGERSSLAELAAANTAFVMVYEIGSISGPILVGAGMDLAGRNSLVVVTAAACTLFFLAERFLISPRARASARAAGGASAPPPGDPPPSRDPAARSG
jgi:MFS family permease